MICVLWQKVLNCINKFHAPKGTMPLVCMGVCVLHLAVVPEYSGVATKHYSALTAIQTHKHQVTYIHSSGPTE